MHTHHHPHTVSTEQMIGRFGWSILLTGVFAAGEAAAGWWYNSLALLADAGHNFADGAALAVSWYALRMSRRASSHHKTFGYHRASILAALINAVSLIGIALTIFYEGIRRLLQPEPVNGGAMIGVACAAVVVNLLIVVWLRHGGSKDINVRSAVLHMFGDMLFSVGVVVAGFVVLYTGWLQADALISLFIGLFIMVSSWGLLKESIHILMEGTPVGLDVRNLVSTIETVPGVVGVHDLHVWTISSGLPMLTAHIVVENQPLSASADIIDTVTHRLQDDFGIYHTTFQTECLACASEHLFCTLDPDRVHTHSH